MAKKTATKTTRSNIPAADFVRAVKEVAEAGGTHSDVASRLGMKVTSVATRISVLRTKHGVNMPAFKRGGGGRPGVDAAALNAILAE